MLGVGVFKVPEGLVDADPVVRVALFARGVSMVVGACILG